MARVFVSHAGVDLALARDVHGWLVEAGHEVFLDRDPRDGLVVGEQWEQRLYERLRWADAVVCVVTSAYLASPWCTAEVGAAHGRGSRILPLRAETGVDHPLLASTQHTDYVADPTQARTALVDALRQVDLDWPPDRSPFPGLRPFEAEQHRVFFGRTEEIGQLVELLRSPAERAEGAALLVVGPSGCGKSSLVRAGLLPVMADEPGWRVLAPILPGADPVGSLARELPTAARWAGLEWTLEHVQAQFDQRGLTELVDELLLADPAGPQRHLLIAVDQFEELLTQAPPAARARFAELLRPALSGPVRVVATLRPEFFDQLLLDPDLAALPTRPYPLRPLRREALRAVIEKPARLAGIEVDDGLVERLVADTDTGEALPLLAFTLAQLADGIPRGGRLSHARYEQLGGVQGALTRQADAALAEAITAGGRRRGEVIAGLLGLVTVDEHGRPTRWRVNRDELPKQVCPELEAFVAHRLLSTDSENGTVVIGVAHEAFLSAWPPLAQAIAQNVSALRARRAVEHAATEWHERGRPSARLWGGGQLAAAVTDTGACIRVRSTSPLRLRPGSSDQPRQRRRVLVTDRVDVSSTTRDFLYDSIRRDRHRRRRATIVLSVLLILALAGGGVAVIEQGEAQELQRIATARQLIAQADAIRNTDPRTALQLGVAAHHINAGGETHASLVNTLTATPYAGTLIGHRGAVTGVTFSLDGKMLATASDDGTAILWDLTNPVRSRLSQLTDHTAAVRAVAFEPDRRILATAGDDGTVILWDLIDPTRPRPLGPPLSDHSEAVYSVAFSPDGRILATGSVDDTVILWDLIDPARPRPLGPPLSDHTAAVISVAFSPDGRILATASNDGSAILWDLTDPTRPHRLDDLTSHTDSVRTVAFASSGHILATGSADGTVILWDLTDPTRPHRLDHVIGHTGSVFSAVFAPDGRTLATGSNSGESILWDLTRPSRPYPLGPRLSGHTDPVRAVAFASSGHILATGSADGTAILWDLTDPTRPNRLSQLTGHTGTVYSAAFSPDGTTLATAGADSTAIVWDLTNLTRPRPVGPPLSGHTAAVFSVAFSPDGRTLVTGSEDSTAAVWDLTDPGRARRLSQLTGHNTQVRSVAFAPDGRTLATASVDRTVILWDLADLTSPRALAPSLTGHTDSVFSVAFVPDGTILATGSVDDTAILWDLKAPTRPRLSQLTGHTAAVFSVAFSPDGRTLATASNDSTVMLWDLTIPTRPRILGPPLTEHTTTVRSVAFASGGHILATASEDNSVILWDLTRLNHLRDHATEHACFLTSGGLDREEWMRNIPGLGYEDICVT